MTGNDFLEVSGSQILSYSSWELTFIGILGRVSSAPWLCRVILHRAKLLLSGRVCQHLTHRLRDNTEPLSVQRGLS